MMTCWCSLKRPHPVGSSLSVLIYLGSSSPTLSWVLSSPFYRCENRTPRVSSLHQTTTNRISDRSCHVRQLHPLLSIPCAHLTAFSPKGKSENLQHCLKQADSRSSRWGGLGRTAKARVHLPGWAVYWLGFLFPVSSLRRVDFKGRFHITLSEGIVWCWAEVDCLLRQLLLPLKEATH